MLSSQITPIYITSTSLYHPSRTSATLIRQTGSLSRRCRPAHQTRAFRLGLWSSYLDPSFQKENRRRHRVVKHKYIEALNRNLSWDRHFPVHPKHLSLKSFMCSAWRGQDPRPGGRWVDVDELFNDKGGMQKGTEKPINNSEQEGVAKLLKRQQEFVRSRLHTISSWNSMLSSETPLKGTASYSSASSVYDLEGFRKRFPNSQDSSTSSDPEYEIDPITNRKVFKNKSNTPIELGRKPMDIPVKTFKGYRSQFQDELPPSSLGTAESSHENGKEDRSVDSYEEGGTPKKVSEEATGFEKYDSKVDYKSGQFYDPSSIRTNDLDPVQKGLKEYDNEISNKGIDSAKSETFDPVQEGLKEYDNTVDYGSGRFYDCSGKEIDYSDPDQSGLKDYDSKISSGGTLSSKPDAKASDSTGSEGWEEYDNQVDYKSGQFYEPARTTIDYADPIQGGLKDYDGKISREGLPNEPTMVATDPITEAFKEYDDYKEPEEKMRPLDPVQEAFHGYDQVHQELKGYEYERSGKMHDDSTREALRDYDSRADYGPKGALGIPMTSTSFIRRVRSVVDKLLHDSPDDLDLLRTSDVRAGSGIMNGPRKETESERLARREQLENDFNQQEIEAASPDELAAAEKVKQSRKLAQNNAPQARNQVKTKVPEIESGRLKPPKLTGNFVRDFPEEFETSWTVDPGSSGGLIPKKKTSISDQQRRAENKVQGDENTYSSQINSSAGFSHNPDIPRIETSLDRTIAQTEETQDNSRNEVRLAEKKKKESDRDLVREVRKIYEEAYGTIDSKHRQGDGMTGGHPLPNAGDGQTAPESGSMSSEPTLYKILAYDPTMQSVSMAVTTSIVPDSSGSLTPAEVLLRLSNPAKFFPHFQPLQSEGYEIVSGSGDVLVFRKVRSGAPQGINVASKPATSEKIQKYKVTNPIDGMQSSPVAATGNFASPTGFVNHDLPGISEPPFKSNIDVRREEPVFSGKRNWKDDSEHDRKKSKSTVKKVLVGGAWVAAASYAVGVVAEYFKTGGVDGKGPQGF